MSGDEESWRGGLSFQQQAERDKTDLSLALDLLEKCYPCLQCGAYMEGHQRECVRAQLLERHGREVRLAK